MLQVQGSLQWILLLVAVGTCVPASTTTAAWIFGEPRQHPVLLLRSGLYWAYVYLWWHALAGMPVGDATALVYCSHLLTDQFTATTKALASYSGRKCADPQGIRITIERQKDVSIPIPTTRTYIGEEVANTLLGK